jgi:hypothetical protein
MIDRHQRDHQGFIGKQITLLLGSPQSSHRVIGSALQHQLVEMLLIQRASTPHLLAPSVASLLSIMLLIIKRVCFISVEKDRCDALLGAK